MTHALKWLGTILQLTGSAMVALHLPWSGWGFPAMLAGSITWGAIAVAHREGALATLTWFSQRSISSGFGGGWRDDALTVGGTDTLKNGIT